MKVKELIEKLQSRNPEEEVYTLDLFLEDEIPFRLRELLGVDDADVEKVEEEILDELCIGRGGSFDSFDYDGFDRSITDILDKHGIKYNYSDESFE